MLGDVINIGEKVVIAIPKENRSWGYNPVPDGTQVIVRGFTEIHYSRTQSFGCKPGVYVNRSWAKVEKPDGEIITIGTFCLNPVDNDVYEKRLEELREKNRIAMENGIPRETDQFIRDLPETKFWEGDVLKKNKYLTEVVSFDPMPEKLVIARIEYSNIDRKRNDGSQMPIYEISESLSAGWRTLNVDADKLELEERGNVWKYYHNEPVHFKDLKEEAEFFYLLGHVDEVRNPESGIFSWTKEEALEAIKNGLGHSMTAGSSFFSFDTPTLRLQRFRDEDLGRRLAAATLEGFSVPA